ncbi:glycosyltransferase family 2 protein [Carboxylicivirga linearis]|uniref:Glycosyltransferase family 2 protein n=1 Tax=Carboxylicivirga linearis TaxID=1628157 RepID=A0ABS5JUM8_9BACT|nr:glycosyltransferase family 2 protein [Carboxylicivirga linearis]MBS2098543.1 glycosyltransferase family 2 protein [Carboxylicivirga linearis]
MQNPLVSILITSYNREKYIAQAIESAINQTYRNIEIIILDDCSTDRSHEIAKDYAEKYDHIFAYRNAENIGQFPNRNKIVEYVKGAYIKYLDSDDLIYPHCIQVMIWAMLAYPQAGQGLCRHYSPDIVFPEAFNPKTAFQSHFFNTPLFTNAPNSVIFKKEAFNQVGGFETDMGINADSWLLFKIGAISETALLPHGLVYYRQGHEQISSNDSVLQRLEQFRFHVPRLLNTDSCPLSQPEKEIAIGNLKGQFIRYILRTIIKLQLSNLKYLSKYYKDIKYLLYKKHVRSF